MAIKRLTDESARKRLAAKNNIKNIPGWADMDADEAAKYVEENVKTVADAKKILKSMSEMLVHLRDLHVK